MLMFLCKLQSSMPCCTVWVQSVWPFEFLNLYSNFHIGYSCIEYYTDSIWIKVKNHLPTQHWLSWRTFHYQKYGTHHFCPVSNNFKSLIKVSLQQMQCGSNFFHSSFLFSLLHLISSISYISESNEISINICLQSAHKTKSLFVMLACLFYLFLFFCSMLASIRRILLTAIT